MIVIFERYLKKFEYIPIIKYGWNMIVVQMDHEGLPLSPRRTRSTASQSSTASSTSHKVQCSRCGRSYGKAYLPKHVCKPK